MILALIYENENLNGLVIKQNLQVQLFELRRQSNGFGNIAQSIALFYIM